MRSIERIAAVLQGRTPDKVPVMHITFSSRVASQILGREVFVGGAVQQWREACSLWEGPQAHAAFLRRSIDDAVAIALACGHDIIRTEYWRDRRKPVARLDLYTFRYESSDGSFEVKRLDPVTELYNVVDSSPVPERTLEALEAEVEVEERSAQSYVPKDGDFVETLEVLRRCGSEYAVRCSGVWNCISMYDPVLFEACLLKPDLVERLLDAQVVRSIKNVDFLFPRGARLFFGGGDLASDKGPAYSPRVFHELLLPRVRAVSDHCHRLGSFHSFGSDGNVWPIAEDFYGASGIDGHHEFDRHAGMNPLEVHRRFPHITMFGNISSHKLHMGSVQDVVAETRACMDEAHATGKVVVGVSNLIVPETPPANVEAMLKTIEQLR